MIKTCSFDDVTDVHNTLISFSFKNVQKHLNSNHILIFYEAKTTTENLFCSLNYSVG